MANALTKQQINQEIADYTRRLNQAQTELASFKSEAAGLDSRITDYQTKIKDRQADLATSQDRLESYQSAHAENDKRTSQFHDLVYQRRSRLSGISDLASTVSAARGYLNQMQDVIYGQQYAQVDDNLSAVKSKLDSESESERGRIADFKHEIENYQGEVSQLRSQLGAKQGQVSGKQADCSAYENKIAQLQSQLQQLG
jgi:chromosome segregation ATPase